MRRKVKNKKNKKKTKQKANLRQTAKRILKRKEIKHHSYKSGGNGVC